MPSPVRTRFAPSPTGFLHLGGARTALFSWAYARRFGGTFILRIEDTDVERSTPQAVDAILEGMRWLELDYDEGPFFQMQRMDRYREVIAEMLGDGRAYLCYTTPVELEQMRTAQRARGEKPRYDGTWRPESGKALPAVPPGIKPVVRFRNPIQGDVEWEDLVKGKIAIANTELDDLIIARPDGTPTYNFCVCVDDWEMGITHVIRGDDHVNNTPRQINILRALGAELPLYGHVPMILGPDGVKLSKRHGAVSVVQYEEDGYLPEAMINYLARLGWSHGDAEIFSRDDLVSWFDARHISHSPAQWDPKKLAWMNNHYIKATSNERLAVLVRPRIEKLGGVVDDRSLPGVLELLKDRAHTLVDLATSALLFYQPFSIAPELKTQHITGAIVPVLAEFLEEGATIAWHREAITTLIQKLLARHALKMPQLAVPLRIATTGQSKTPSVDAVLELLGRERVLKRIRETLG
ncbi:MAG: glutamate--tRNA ligase [Burkholderiaceae bacterium]|jgi:glutamyl-tRNA synthetase